MIFWSEACQPIRHFTLILLSSADVSQVKYYY